MKNKTNLISVYDIILLNIVAILSIRQIANVAPYGASSIILWILAGILFFIPLSLVSGELSTGWPKQGGLFVWVKEAFGSRVGWIVVFLYLTSCIIFFPLMLQFLFTTLGFIIGHSLDSNKTFIGVASIMTMWIMTFLNVKGMKWTKRVNNFGAIIGVFIPGIIIILIALYWLVTGHSMETNYGSITEWIPNLSQWNTIVFLSAMMFAFAGMELSPMIANHSKNPQKDYPKAILGSMIVIVTIYILGTVSLNVLFPAEDANIVAGIMQAVQSASLKLNIPWLLPVLGSLIAIGALGQINSWLVVPIYMLNVASSEHNILGNKLSKAHPKYESPSNALYLQAIIVTIFCLATFISPNAEAAYWTLTALTTLVYFIPYLFMFAAYYKLRKTKSDVERSFVIPGKILPVLIPVVGFLSILFAIILIFIPPVEIDLGSIILYELKIGGGGLLTILIADWLYRKARKKEKAKKGEVQ